MQEVRVLLLDDVHWAEEQEKVESSCTHYLELDGRRVRLDLTDVHEKELFADVKRWLAAGRPVDEKPVARLGFKAGSGESKRWHADLRAWADSEGRTAEYTKRHRDGSKVDGDYKYPRRLVEDYEDYLLARAKAS